MSVGAMAERVRRQLERARFDRIWAGAPPLRIDEAVINPLFTREIIEVMGWTIPAGRQDYVATGVIVKAREPRSEIGAKDPDEGRMPVRRESGRRVAGFAAAGRARYGVDHDPVAGPTLGLGLTGPLRAR